MPPADLDQVDPRRTHHFESSAIAAEFLQPRRQHPTAQKAEQLKIAVGSTRTRKQGQGISLQLPRDLLLQLLPMGVVFDCFLTDEGVLLVPQGRPPAPADLQLPDWLKRLKDSKPTR